VAQDNDAANPTAHHGNAEHHAHGVGRYWLVWALLIACTGLTVYTGHFHPNIYLALVIAAFKASLVVLFFMHMTEAPGANRLVFSVSLVFTLVMMAGVFGDLLTRNPMSLPSGSVPAEVRAP
jgi:cytochrome c oxidase subunit 4